ncbi:BREX-1 system adenine-specific DNA-methyltransferase PglX [Massilia pinisoli]|uniref:site-specific DNA-methyltransferase (adenine-specific) n=1 Tax=Massilia pinisoli TaxID=1772194 RepID=A0ABT1ZZG9_9BURK|nr:BREX-1 system adenine-specific DNA-methyltransferase PglX [Massilia pinisoli]MCS0585328.1 BREX-1 system adenine-specific DNA-methyltransferase PglX [Massilia pinisoli]
MSNSQASTPEQAIKKYFSRASAEDFEKIPGNPIAYWANESLLEKFVSLKKLSSIASPKKGLVTSDNERFLKKWFEVSRNKVGFGFSSRVEAQRSKNKWFPINAGGGYRKWYGNAEILVNWENDGEEIIDYAAKLYGSASRQIQNTNYYFLECITWSNITSSGYGARYCDGGFVFGAAGTACIPQVENSIEGVLSFLNSFVAKYALQVLNPTLNFLVADISALPLDTGAAFSDQVKAASRTNICLAKEDWNTYETSWDFSKSPLLQASHSQTTLKTSYQRLRTHWREVTLEMQRLEQENNRIFIDAYGLQDELKPDVPLNEITLTCNPHYRYGGDKSEDELEALLLADTMRELVSYAVGCMFGRYSLDKPGLILANQGEMLADYLAQVPQPSFPADDDNVVPLLDGDWFPDDITLRFRQFLRVAFGDAHYEDNLAFIEQALNLKGKRNYSLRDYFLSEFYADHVKRYKKRPIYWLFSSPKGSFNALIYMHRYRPDMVSVVLKYLRDYREKLVTEKERQASASINPATSQGDKTRALKEVDRLAKVLAELEDYERDVLYPLATEQKPINLDDGVKVNYSKFGLALKKIPGLDAKDED